LRLNVLCSLAFVCCAGPVYLLRTTGVPRPPPSVETARISVAVDGRGLVGVGGSARAVRCFCWCFQNDQDCARRQETVTFWTRGVPTLNLRRPSTEALGASCLEWRGDIRGLRDQSVYQPFRPARPVLPKFWPAQCIRGVEENSQHVRCFAVQDSRLR